MNLPTMVEVGIGLAFLYLMLSLMAAVLNEMVLTVLDLRAKQLKATITALLDDAELHDHFYRSSLFASLNTFMAEVMGKKRGGGSDPAGSTAAAAATDASADPTRHPSYLDSKTFATALVGALIKRAEARAKTVAAASAMARTVTPVDLRNAINDLSETRIKKALQSLMATGDQTVDGFEQRAAVWFDGCMARLSGVFKRNATYLSIAVGFVLAAAINADSLAVGYALGTDQTLRQAVVDGATAYLEAHPDYLPPTCRKDGDAIPADTLKCQMKLLSDQSEAITPFPLGWSEAVMLHQRVGWDLEDPFRRGMWWLLKILGFVATAFAVSLGAPFWFDVLQMFMKMRNTGPKPPETTQATDAQPK